MLAWSWAEICSGGSLSVNDTNPRQGGTLRQCQTGLSISMDRSLGLLCSVSRIVHPCALSTCSRARRYVAPLCP